MKVTLSNGNLLIGDVLLCSRQSIQQCISEINARNYDCKSSNENLSYRSYNVLGIPDEGEMYNLQLYFNKDQLISISVSKDTDDKTLDEFISKSLKRVQFETYELLKRMLSGLDRYEGEWGTIEYYFDPRSFSVTIVVNYKN
ncbi:MAG: hypothetical protein U0V74_06015 [Chitinophagales bacterium]